MTEAAAWAVRLDADRSTATHQRFETWLAHPGNDAAWTAVQDARETSTVLADHPALLTHRHAAVARAALTREPRRPSWMLAAAACAAVVAPLALWQFAGSDRAGPPPSALAASPVYRTAVGQRLMTTLADGSRLTLDTDSRVRVAYTGTERRLTLERGQALFEVAKHQPRPFVVVAGSHAVTAHGTAFDVRLGPSVVRVALIEGLVSVAARSGAGTNPVSLRPDDILTATLASVSVRHLPGGAQALSSWSEGRLVFEDETLDRAVAEMNRYGGPRIVVTDPAAGRVRISGSFRTGEIEPFLEALQMGFPVTIAHADDRITIGTKK